jgi:hypothetical protein
VSAGDETVFADAEDNDVQIRREKGTAEEHQNIQKGAFAAPVSPDEDMKPAKGLLHPFQASVVVGF